MRLFREYPTQEKLKKWQARIKINGKNIHLGLFHTEEEAHQAYLEGKKIYHVIKTQQGEKQYDSTTIQTNSGNFRIKQKRTCGQDVNF